MDKEIVKCPKCGGGLHWGERIFIALIDGFEWFLDRCPPLDYVVCKILDKIQDVIRWFVHAKRRYLRRNRE